jgi:hypothetical protein
MDSATIRDEILRELDRLSPEQQKRLLDMAKQLNDALRPPGTSGSVLLSHMDDFSFAPGDLDDMMRVIEEGCERIDWNGWQ